MDYKLFAESFQKILLSRVFDRKRWVQELANALNLGIDAIYKKSRFDSSYSLDEFLFLSKKYNIDFNEVVNLVNKNNPKALVDSCDFGSIEVFTESLQKILSESLTQNTEIKSYSNEIPFFYFFNDRTLAAYKIFSRSSSLLNKAEKKKISFNSDIVDEKIYDVCVRISNMYASVKFEEIWNLRAIEHEFLRLNSLYENSTLKRRDYEYLYDLHLDIIKTNLLKENSIFVLTDSNGSIDSEDHHAINTSSYLLIHSNEVNVGFMNFNEANYLEFQYPQMTRWLLHSYMQCKKQNSLNEKKKIQILNFIEDIKEAKKK
jgi:hypothetical protein